MRDCLENLMSEKLINIKYELKEYGVSMSKLSIMEATIYDRNIVVLENNNLLPFLEDCYNEFKIKYTEITGREYSDNK